MRDFSIKLDRWLTTPPEDYGYDQIHLIFEGADCVGKTTLINNFIDLWCDYDFELKKFSKPTSKLQAKIDYAEYISELQIKPYTIADRFMYGEGVYGPIFRGYSPKYLKRFDKLISEIPNTVIIYVTASNEWVKEHFDGIELNGGELEKQGYIKNCFEEIISRSEVPTIIIDNTHLTEEEALQRLENKLTRILK